MPEPTFLQIQGPGDPTMRMIEMPPGPLRIGRGAHCEVRLGDPGLGDVQCILRRRGATWHFQPVGPAGQVWIDGRAVDQQRAIPLGVPFCVGEHWLVLRPADSATNDWGTFDAPITVEVQAEAEAEAKPVDRPPSIPTAEEREPASGRAQARPSPPTDDNEERLRRWEARLEQRERWLKDRQEERRWEARWKSAGESIRARSSPPPARPPAPPRTSPTRPTPTPSMPSRPLQTPPVARIIEPKGPAEPIRRVAGPSPRPPAPRVVVRPSLDHPTPIPRPVAPSPLRVEPRPAMAEPKAPPRTPDVSTSRALVTLSPIPTLIPIATPREAMVEEEAPASAASIGPEPAVEVTPPVVEMASVAAPVEVDLPAIGPVAGIIEDDAPIEADLVVEASDDLVPGPLEASSVVPVDAPTLIESSDWDVTADSWTLFLPLSPGEGRGEGRGTSGGSRTRPFPEPAGNAAPLTPDPSPKGRGEEEKPEPHDSLATPSDWIEEDLPVAAEDARRAEIAPRAAEPHPAEPEVVRQVEHSTELPRSSGLSRAEWPSARAIFAAQGRRVSPEPEVAKPARRKPSGSKPTEALGPACWSMPLWLGWFPTLVASLMVGLGGVALAYEWSMEASRAEFAIRLAMRPEGAPGSTIDPTLIPRGGWWTSTATHLSAWAMALIRAGDGEDHSEEIRSLLESSGNASRLASRSRFVVELPATTEPGSPADLSHLGRTRDVVTLVWTGRRLGKLGKRDSALRAFRSAMEIASRADSRDLDPPTFFEDPQVRRYALPREALLAFVVKAMTQDGEWTRDQWAEALPPSAAASMVASRVFAGMQKRAEADRLADQAIRQAEAPTPPGYDSAEDRAAGAEALAYRGRWPEAADQYRQAIDLAEDDATRRMWWLNLAEVAQRMQDDAGRVRAIEAAKAPSSVDEVTRRALKYQQGLPGLASTSPRR